MWFHVMWCYAMWCYGIRGAVPYRTVQYRTVLYNTIQFTTIQYNAMQWNTMYCNRTVPYNAMQCNAVQCNFATGVWSVVTTHKFKTKYIPYLKMKWQCKRRQSKRIAHHFFVVYATCRTSIQFDISFILFYLFWTYGCSSRMLVTQHTQHIAQ